MYLIYHGFIKTKEMKQMVKRVLSVVGVFFLYFLVLLIATIGFQFLVEGRLPLTEDQFFHYSGSFGITVAALFTVWFSHAKGISKDLDSRKDRSFIKMIVVAVFSVCIGTILLETPAVSRSSRSSTRGTCARTTRATPSPPESSRGSTAARAMFASSPRCTSATSLTSLFHHSEK